MPKVYLQVSLLECGDAEAAHLIETAFAQYVVRRLSETVFVVDHERLDAMVGQMRRQGITPKETMG